MKKQLLALATLGVVGFASAGTMSLIPVYLGRSAGPVTIPSDGSDPAGLAPGAIPAGSTDILALAVNADGSTVNDLLALNVQQAGAPNALEFQNGEPGALAGNPTTMGFFFLKGTSATGEKIIASSQGNGSPFSFWTGNTEGAGAFQTVAVGVNAGSTTLQFGDIPEPATLSLAGIAGLGLIRRRRA